MKRFGKRLWESTAVWLALIIVAQTVVYVLAGASKAYFHMDEIYSYGLANHSKVQIYETEGFYDEWHIGDYYDEYLTVGEDERGDFRPVYENQKNDVHPPLFYFLLRLGMEMTPGQFSKWTGIVLNILVAGVSTVVLWLIVKKLTGGQKVKTLVLTAVVALGIWPWGVQHMFFGYRGEGVMATLGQPLVLLANLWTYVGVLDEYVFHKLLLVIVLGLMLIGGYVIMMQKRLTVAKGQGEKVVMILAPTLFYLVVVAAASPFAALRYVAPVCGLLLVLVLWSLWGLSEGVWGKKWGNLGMVVVIAVFSIVMPVAAGLAPDVVYRERAEWMEKVEELSEVPAVYLMKTGDDWGFLNDILLVREIKESYIAKDVGVDEEVLKEILAGKDLGEGLIVFINDGQDNEDVLEAVKSATGLDEVEYAQRLVMSDVYYLK